MIDAAKGRAVSILHCYASSIIIKGTPSRVLIGTSVNQLRLINFILLDQCQHTRVTCEGDVSSSVDVVASLDIEVKAKGNVKEVSVTKTHGAEVHVAWTPRVHVLISAGHCKRVERVRC